MLKSYFPFEKFRSLYSFYVWMREQSGKLKKEKKNRIKSWVVWWKNKRVKRQKKKKKKKKKKKRVKCCTSFDWRNKNNICIYI